MPDLDVSFVLDDPMFSDTFAVCRRPETLVDGRTVVGEQWFSNVEGVVTQESPADIMRREEGVMVPQRIFIATRFRMYKAAVGYQPDKIRWNGTDYYVESVLPYSRYGEGFYEVIASSQSQPDQPTQ